MSAVVENCRSLTRSVFTRNHLQDGSSRIRVEGCINGLQEKRNEKI